MSCVARVGRIVPAYGVGGFVNTRLRASLMKGVEEKDEERGYNVL